MMCATICQFRAAQVAPRLVRCMAVISTRLHTDKPVFRIPPTVAKLRFSGGSLSINDHNLNLGCEMPIAACDARSDARSKEALVTLAIQRWARRAEYPSQPYAPFP